MVRNKVELMRSINDWLDEYHESHHNPVNKILHWICVPAIMLSLLGLMWPVKISYGDSSLSVNLAVLFILASLAYYAFLSIPLTIGMLIVSTLMLVALYILSGLSTPLWLICISVFVIAWIGQFIGHHVEGRKPSFFKDVQFLLIGPLWLLSFIYRKLGIAY